MTSGEPRWVFRTDRKATDLDAAAETAYVAYDGWLAKRGIPAEIIDSYLRPSYGSRQIRRDTKRFIVGVHNRYTLAAAKALTGFSKPVLLVRAEDDRIFRAQLFERLAATLPDARLVTVADSSTFVSEDQPAELARLVVSFAAA
ncbi:alpha/beta fold hydrolase [Micromonospora parathelypteridis]|uniref:Pimeloyl-ACP methyl ester carboxylesterase n=1 Tax=Micromonospora parathelypteridis TaxID=1839617 RepID=A0A840VTV9_9ACTN|nr:alpha/beta hydrolase [Micromonospora parathelypteridis]MBB5480632.1 pimeloyl-ACP methyl ester carboxylesterase [Micromonospora parathelypteridis]